MVQGSIRNSLQNDFKNIKLRYLMPQVFNIPKVEHDQPWSTLVVLFFKISLFIYVILGNGPISAKNNVNKQTNFEKQNNQSWAWLIMLNFGNVKNLGHKTHMASLEDQINHPS